MENDEPIYREELRAMLFLLADIRMAVEEILSYIKARMKRKKRKNLTPEERKEREEREIRSEALDRMLRDRIERIEAELLAKDPNYRGLGYWIEQVRAEREAENAA